MAEYKEMSDSKIVEKFEKDYESMKDYWDTLHARHQKDTQFTWFGDQWDQQAKDDRRSTGRTGTSTPLPPRPTMVFNISKPFIVKVINGVKKMKPSLKVSPVDGESDVKLAQVRRGILKSIEKNTGAIPARINALKDAVTSGYGFYRFDTDWENPHSFDQDIRYHIIEDATNVLWDDDSKAPDGSDCKKVQFRETISEHEFKKLTGHEWEDWKGQQEGEMSQAWGNQDKPCLTEYWYIEEIPETLVMIDIERVIPQDMSDIERQQFIQTLPEDVVKSNEKGMFLKDLRKAIEDTEYEAEDFIDIDDEGEYIKRSSNSRKVWRCKMVGKKVYKKKQWDGYYIPVFKIDGRKTVSNGKVRFDGLSHDTQPSQKSYNYARNNKLERLALSPKIPWIYAEGSLSKKSKEKMDTANSRNWPSIGVKSTDQQGNPYFQPYRPNPINIDPGLTQEELTSAEEIKASLGMFGSYMGDTVGEKSGKAIMAGAAESSDITFDFAYNMGLTMDHEGTVINELIPKVIDTPRQVRMVGEDDEESVIWVNQKAQDEKGDDYYYDLNQGKFDINVSMGASSETKRMEQRDEMEALFGKAPELREVLADIFVKTHDWEKADEASKRIKAFIKQKYPGIIEDDDENAPPPEVMQMQQQMQEMGQQMQMMAQENEQLKLDKSLEAKKLENEDLNNEEKNENSFFDSETKRFQARQQANQDNQELQFKIKEAERKHILEMAKIEASKQNELKNQTDENGKQQITQYFDSLKSDLETQLQALKDDVSNKMLEIASKPPPEPPDINITNVIPKPGKKTITPKANGAFDVEETE
ncbi:MAG: hypothetical protein GY861_14655 [bacterium]|nr:hypothetical protein [bacterium]